MEKTKLPPIALGTWSWGSGMAGGDPVPNAIGGNFVVFIILYCFVYQCIFIHLPITGPISRYEYVGISKSTRLSFV